MGTIDEEWQNYYARSARLGDVARQLAFAGVALIWLLSGGEDHPNDVHVASNLHVPAFAFVTTLLLDVLHQAYSTLGVRVITRHHEKKKETAFEYPKWFPWPAEWLVVFKVVALGLAYTWIAAVLGTHWL